MKARWLTLWLVLLLSRSVSGAEHPGDLTRVLEDGSPEQWPAAIQELLGEDVVAPSRAVTTLLEVLPSLEAPERAAVAWSLRRQDHNRAAQQALAELALDDDRDVRERAAQALARCISWQNADLLLPLLRPDEPLRVEMVEALRRAYVDDLEERTKEAGLAPVELRHTYALSLEPGAEVPAVQAIIPLLEDPDPLICERIVKELRWFIDPAVDLALLEMARERRDQARQAALWALAYRRNAVALEPLLGYASEAAARQERDRRFGWIGDAYRESGMLRFFELYETAAAESERQDVRCLIGSALRSELIDDIQLMAAMPGFADHADPFLAETAGTLLRWRAEADDERARAELGGVGSLLFVVLTSVVAAALGLVLFLWAFRMLQLKVLLGRTSVSRTRSLALGAALVRGEVQPVAGKALVHPVTGEACLFYPGADVDHPRHRFWLVDDTGRVLVDPARAVLLSEDGVLEIGETAMIMAEVGLRPSLSSSGSGSGRGRYLLRKKQVTRSLLQKAVHILVQGVMGGWARHGSARAMFSDPAAVFWIWDSPGDRPFSSARETALLVLTFLVAGAWIVVFAASVITMIDVQSGAALVRWLSLVLGS